MTAMRVIVALGVLGALSACSAGVQLGNRGVVGSLAPTSVAPAAQPAMPVSPQDRLVSAIEAQGCRLNAENVGAVLLRANLTQQELMRITPELAAEGRVRVSDEGTIRVLSPSCL
ncbi:hypothetical protein [Limimaricola pyoseonensis]|uniref:Lipoprotein n=1 Tax=Limimaricola pyoseonensis TaxID=521013 RepID=A0A1G6ZGC9_9RHOB|nr:hypothetical protein [Limimaricola pyoseonensis]SDE00756.1 hypothetical protein SAMN04488567_0497 [Limimaricola pyoseonensis]